MSIRLSRATLSDLPERVGRPAYKSEDLSAGIVHFGVGNFHRAHQASYLDQLFSMGLGRDWAIVGASVMPGDEKARNIFLAQDFISLLVEQSADGAVGRVTCPMIEYVPVTDGDAISARMAEPDIRIVSLTVTEGGYFLDADGHFDPTNPAIIADAATPDDPKTVFGLMLKALRMRRAAGHAPFTVMCCDNVPHNGVVTRGTLAGLARLSDPDFADWVEQNVSFPNAMVDRITPATSERERERARDDWGVADDWPVFSEDFIQWVIEDDFPQGRPPLEEVGVQFVEDVTPYELMKLRILNGGHAMIAYASALMGIEFADAAMRHEQVAQFVETVLRKEVIPGVAAVPGTDPTEYSRIVRARFANPNVADTTRRLCLDGSNRQPKFIVPSIRDAIKRDAPLDGLALASALWCRYCLGTLEDGTPIEPNDPIWDDLTKVAKEAQSRPDAWLEMEKVYGELGRNPRLREAFARWLNTLREKGVEATLAAYLDA